MSKKKRRCGADWLIVFRFLHCGNVVKNNLEPGRVHARLSFKLFRHDVYPPTEHGKGAGMREPGWFAPRALRSHATRGHRLEKRPRNDGTA